jgi:hypothetical protein
MKAIVQLTSSIFGEQGSDPARAALRGLLQPERIAA